MKHVMFDGKIIMCMHICWIEISEVDGFKSIILHLSDGSSHSEPAESAKAKFAAIGI